MFTSSSRRRPDRPGWAARALETAGIATVFALLPELAAVRAGVVLDPNPGWIAVMLLAARHGGRGLLAGVAAMFVALGLGSTLGLGGTALWSSLHSTPNLIACAACFLVAWIGSLHLRFQRRLMERLTMHSDRIAELEATIETLMGVAESLRARVDRTSNSLSFLRDVAKRLDGEEPVAAAEGAADLALARTGADAAVVTLELAGTASVQAVRDARGPRAVTPLALAEADVKEPIRDGEERVGALLLWGIQHGALDEATRHDLRVIASWCAPAIAYAARHSAATGGRPWSLW